MTHQLQPTLLFPKMVTSSDDFHGSIFKLHYTARVTTLQKKIIIREEIKKDTANIHESALNVYPQEPNERADSLVNDTPLVT